MCGEDREKERDLTVPVQEIFPPQWDKKTYPDPTTDTCRLHQDIPFTMAGIPARVNN
jgi:hypothetical protein